MLALPGQIQQDGPLTLLEAADGDDTRTWEFTQHEHAGQRDWRRADPAGRAAAGLRSRCDAADLYEAALLTDPLHRRRAVHTGHVVTGTAAAPAEARPPTVGHLRPDEQPAPRRHRHHGLGR